MVKISKVVVLVVPYSALIACAQISGLDNEYILDFASNSGTGPTGSSAMNSGGSSSGEASGGGGSGGGGGGDSCPLGFGDCDSNEANGCETNLQATATHCGNCETVCGFGADSFPVCDSGICTIGCNSGFGNCDGKDSNGCEANIKNDPTNCGGCVLPCPSAMNADAVCVDGMCGLACIDGFGDCDGQAQNGCELDLHEDPENCMQCGNDCMGGGCNNGICSPSPEAIVTGQSEPWDAVANSANIFWTIHDNWGGVSRADINGANITHLHDAASGYSRAVVLYGQDVYWGGGGQNTITIEKISQAGQNYEIIDPAQAGVSFTGGLAVDGEAWFTCVINPASVCKNTGVAPNVVFQWVGGSISDVAIDQNNLYVGGSKIWSMDKATSASTILLDSASVGHMALFGGDVYWLEADKVLKISTTGGSVMTLATGQTGTTSIAVDSSGVYWTTDVSVETVPLSGGMVKTIAVGLPQAQGITLNSTFVYWVEPFNGRIMRVPK